MVNIPQNDTSGGLTREERIDVIIRVLLNGSYVRTSLNQYGAGKIRRVTYKNPETKKCSVWYDTVRAANCPDDSCKEEVLFLPAHDEVMEALDQFKAKGWHAFHDYETDEYGVCREKYSRGEYADRQTAWLF